MKKILFLGCLILVLSGCAQNKSENLNQPESGESVINSESNLVLADFTSPEQINQLEKIKEYFILRTVAYNGGQVTLLAKNYELNEVAMWNAAPMGIEQKGEFYLYSGSLDNFSEDNLYELGELLYSGTREYFKIMATQDFTFLVIEQYEMNNFSKFHFWQLNPLAEPHFIPAKFTANHWSNVATKARSNYILSGWGYSSLWFKGNILSSHGYYGAIGPEDIGYSESDDDYWWTGKLFVPLASKRLIDVIDNNKNKYSYIFYPDNDLTKRQLQFTLKEGFSASYSGSFDQVLEVKVQDINGKINLLLYISKQDSEDLVKANLLIAEYTQQDNLTLAYYKEIDSQDLQIFFDTLKLNNKLVFKKMTSEGKVLQANFLDFSDSQLGLSFSYPDYWGQAQGSLHGSAPTGDDDCAGYSYNFTFGGQSGNSALGWGRMTAGGRSLDYCAERGHYIADFSGFAGQTTQEVCAQFHARECLPLTADKILMLVIPAYDDVCPPNPGQYWFTAVLAYNLPHQEKIKGLIFEYSFMSNDLENEINNSLNDFADCYLPTDSAKEKFTAKAEEIYQAVINRTADELTLKYYDDFKKFSQSLSTF